MIVEAALAAVMGLAVLLWRIRDPECLCELCPTHRQERAAKAEASRVKRHRAAHSNWGVPWGDPRCGACKAGYQSDRED